MSKNKSFDDILKEGKDKAKVSVDSLKTWRMHVRNLMNTLHELNDMYDSNEVHHLKVDLCQCQKCNTASFILSVRDIDNSKKIIKFHKEKWRALERGKYYCEACRKGK